MKKLLLLFVFCLLQISVEAQLTRTHVAQGLIEGVVEDGFVHYKGVPFAQPPVGDLRWKAPVPAKKWEGVYEAKKFKAKNYQRSNKPFTKEEISEDCLYLNILTPAKSREEKLPVLVYIHGGGFMDGEPWGLNGDNFAKAGIIYVSIEYRCNIFGFLALPELSKESLKENGHAVSGNYGIMDQIMALQWIHDNIEAFGGDSDKVTILGESAGAISVAILCQSPLAKGLFRGAVSQSGGQMSFPAIERTDSKEMRILSASEDFGSGIIQRLGFGKKKLKDLRKMDPSVFMTDSLAFAPSVSLWPCYDDYVITTDAYRQYEAGNYNDVNVLIGTNSDEGSMFASPAFGHKCSPETYAEEMKSSFPDAVWRSKFIDMYPGNTYQEAFDGYSDYFRESAFAWPTYAWGNLQSERTTKGEGKGNVYMYFFDQDKSNFFRMGQSTDRQYLTMHAADLSYITGHWHSDSEIHSLEDEAMSKVMMQYWINFIKTGNPNGGYLPHWPSYRKGTATVMYFRDGAHLTTIPNQQQLDLWQSYSDAIRNR